MSRVFAAFNKGSLTVEIITNMYSLGSSRAMDTDQESVSTNNNPGLDTSVESFDAAITLGDQSAGTNVSVGAR